MEAGQEARSFLGDTGQGGGWPSSQEAGKSEAKAGQGLMMLITTEKIHSAQGSPQTNLGSAHIGREDSRSKASTQLIQRNPAVWPGCWRTRDLLSREEMSQASLLWISQHPGDQPTVRGHMRKLSSYEPGSYQNNYLVDSKNYE